MNESDADQSEELLGCFLESGKYASAFLEP